MSLSTHRKKNEVLLIVFSNAVIYPWTVMVHFTYTSLANGAVMGTFRFNTTTFGALKNHLTFTVTHLFNHFFGCIAPWNSSLGRKETCIYYLLHPHLNLINADTTALLTGSDSIVRTCEANAKKANIWNIIIFTVLNTG